MRSATASGRTLASARFFQQSPTVQIAGLFSLISVQFISVLFYARFQVPSRLCLPLSMSTLRPL